MAHKAETFRYIRALHRSGFYVGPRDPDRNRAFGGDYMVAEDLFVGPTDDGGTGGYCTVGDDLHRLAVEACADNGLSPE